MSQPVAGMLLVASPALVDPNFADSVVLLLDVDDNGALGVVLNRPSGVPVNAVLEGWADVVAEPEVLFQGGPVGADGALAVALLRDPEDVPVGFRAVNGRLGSVRRPRTLLDLGADPRCNGIGGADAAGHHGQQEVLLGGGLRQRLGGGG
jgi:hypothetical protein